MNPRPALLVNAQEHAARAARLKRCRFLTEFKAEKLFRSSPDVQRYARLQAAMREFDRKAETHDALALQYLEASVTAK